MPGRTCTGRAAVSLSPTAPRSPRTTWWRPSRPDDPAEGAGPGDRVDDDRGRTPRQQPPVLLTQSAPYRGLGPARGPQQSLLRDRGLPRGHAHHRRLPAPLTPSGQRPRVGPPSASTQLPLDIRRLTPLRRRLWQSGDDRPTGLPRTGGAVPLPGPSDLRTNTTADHGASRPILRCDLINFPFSAWEPPAGADACTSWPTTRGA